MRCTWLSAFAAISLAGCGDVKGAMVDAGAGTDGRSGADAGIDAVSGTGPCANTQCILFDDFTGPGLNTSMWAVTTTNGATATQANGKLILRLPAGAADASVDVHSVIGFPIGVAFEAKVTFTAGQLFDHKGVGFASSAVSHQCPVGETDAAMFRGQDEDSYIETKSANAWSCTKTTTKYAAGANKLEIVRTGDQVAFRQNDIALPSITTNLPGGLLPVRFSAYSFTTGAPTTPVQIDVDYVLVKQP